MIGGTSMKKSTNFGSIAVVCALLAGGVFGAAPASTAGNWWGWTDRSYSSCIVQTAKKAASLAGAGNVITKMRVCSKLSNPQSGTWYVSDLYY